MRTHVRKGAMTAPQPLELTDAQIRSLQVKSLEIFDYFAEFCAAHGLTVFLDAGGLLGAVREKGFIAWDDDVDVIMPRPDFDRFMDLWPLHADTARYPVVRTTETLVTKDPMVKVYDTATCCVTAEHWDIDMPQGLSLDVIPLDGCPVSKVGQWIQVMWGMVYNLYNAGFVPDNHGKLMEWGSRLLLGLVRSPRARYRLWKFAESRMTATPYGSTPWVRYLYSGPMYMKKIFPLKDFASAVELEFEGRMVPAPVGYDEYLTIFYGDYMTPPPPEMRRPHHDIVFLDLDNPYEQYKGTEYCVSPTTP